MAIEDQQQFKDFVNMMKTMKLAKAFFPGLVETTEEEIAEWEEQANSLRTLPDRFNKKFLPRGWVYTANTSTEAAEKALEIEQSEGIEAAEDYLEDYYEEHWWFLSMRFFTELKRCQQVKEAVARQKLIERAWDDHVQKRYHATVPLITAQIEGIIQDLTGKTFYNKKDTEHLSANETLASDPSALPELAKMMSKPRTQTTSEPLDVPQRHGVLHGRDLGYDNRRTSSKAFATILSLTELIEAVTNDEQFKIPKVEYPDPEAMTWKDVTEIWNDVLKSIKEYGDSRRENEAN